MIAQAARHVRGIEAEVRLVIHATGLLQMDGFTPKKSRRDLDAVHMARAFAVPFASPRLGVHPPAVAAYHLRAVIDQLTAEAIGGFFDGRGQPVPR